ncbi:hypothetical protein KKG46_01160 [Patescibacteria group bacterium]|nr:hypothetical protein [Patescibacteria group bacterium]
MMNNRFIKPKKPMRLGSDANSRFATKDKSRPTMHNNHRAKQRSPDPDDTQIEAVQLDLPYIDEEGNVLFWTALCSCLKPPTPEDK